MLTDAQEQRRETLQRQSRKDDMQVGNSSWLQIQINNSLDGRLKV